MLANELATGLRGVRVRGQILPGRAITYSVRLSKSVRYSKRLPAGERCGQIRLHESARGPSASYDDGLPLDRCKAFADTLDCEFNVLGRAEIKNHDMVGRAVDDALEC